MARAKTKTAAERQTENLTNQQILSALRALQRGDFDVRMSEGYAGIQGQICQSYNAVSEMVQGLTEEVGKLRTKVGMGRTSLRMPDRGLRGGWGSISEAINEMLDDLTSHSAEIARVVTSVGRGDLSQRIALDGGQDPLQGDFLRDAKTVNGMVDQLEIFGSEVTRVARQVGIAGKLGAQAEIPGVSGSWRELTDSVNQMASNLTSQVREIARVTTSVAQGDLTQTVDIEARGEILELKKTINTMVDQLGSFADEVTRVAREVGTEGQLGGQAQVKGVSGIWKELTQNVNSMANNLTGQVRDIAQVTTAVANGDLSKKITVEVKGEILELKKTINAMVDSLSAFADEVTRMARDVGTEGVLGGQAEVRDVSGIWRELTDNVNSMASNLTNQVRNLSEVATAVANGDLSKKITVDAKGEILELKNTINTMVDQLGSFADEVTRVAREVGVEGKLGGQAEVEGVKGTWKELTNNVNLMATNLTNQVRDIAEVTTAVARGDLTRKITVEARGEILELKNTINTMVDQLGSFADEVTRLAVEVGLEGKLGGQADVRGVLGTWRELTDAVNSMATNLTDQVRSISQVSTAIAQGDLRKKIQVEARGEIAELKSTINTMVDQLNSFADEVTRVAREVGIEGKLGGQAVVPGVSGTWEELTDNVNSMATNLTDQVRDIAEVTTAVAAGDLSRKISVEVRGELAELKDTINTMVDQLNSFAGEVTRVAREVGTEGKLGGQAAVPGVSGTWKELTDNANLMASNLTDQVRDIAEVTTAVAQGDLSRKITVEVRGELAELKRTINTMVDQLSSFADEVTRMAREVGMEGVLGGQAQVKGVSGIWKELTGNVNLMAANLTEQVRGIARVVTAVANGDLEQKLHLAARGEIAALVDTINGMIGTLSTFADEVTRVAREVGVEGKLGGQADVPGAAGGWRDLTDNVNELAGNLTRQVRAIGDVATAVTKGDLTRTIDVEASGEVAELKDNLNQMIETLADTTQTNEEQDWLKTHLTRFSRMLQGQRDLLTVSEQVLSELAPVVDARHGAFYMARHEENGKFLDLFASYALEKKRKKAAHRFELGEGLVGQAAVEKKRIHMTDIPRDYVEVASGLGKASPRSLVIVPILFEGEVKGVIELASFQSFTRIQLAFLDQFLESLGIVLATIEATMRTDELLRRSQTMAGELKSQQEELQQTNEELEEKARLLTEQRDEVERKNREVELAKEELEEKAEQLALTSKYKSQFLANMSHELRTPLNSLLILSHRLAANSEDRLKPKEVEYAETIHQAGTDLLDLINEILDLAKIESGTIAVDPHEIRFDSLYEYVERSFGQIAEEKGLELRIEIAEQLPETLVTDDIRLKQVLRNLLSNAIKFTDRGEVVYRAEPIEDPQILNRPVFVGVEEVVAFSVRDTGIGIPRDKRNLIFEAFQQAEGGTARKYGGTGLGLSISREIAQLLGGILTVQSEVGEGSIFTLYLPRLFRERPRATSLSAPSREARSRLTPQTSQNPMFDDDRSRLEPGDRVLLIVEDDETFSKTLLEMAREEGFRGVVASRGEDAIRLARELEPDAAILDLVLPDMDGWVLLDRLKRDPDLRHIPVHILSGAGEEHRGLEQGALEVLVKPVDDDEIAAAFGRIHDYLELEVRQLLVVEAEEGQLRRIVELIGNGDVETTTATTAEEALEILRSSQPFDCMILDVELPDLPGMELIRRIEDDRSLQRPPVVVYPAKELSSEERTELALLAESLIVKEVRSPDRLLDAAMLFLHRRECHLSEPKRKLLRGLAHCDPALRGKKVLVVDDDVRNIFAVTAVLEQHEVQVVFAEDGREGLERLEENDDVDAVLMDIMMPEMDGYEAMRRIRQQSNGKDLPIIAVTAKAMKGDREKCIEAGASDYVTKPVEPDQLVSLLRVWLYR